MGLYTAMAEITVDSSDLEKILDTLQRCDEFFTNRDRMNAAGHLAQDVRFSPLTSSVSASRDRLLNIVYQGDPKY